jgi:hypothetical protein
MLTVICHCGYSFFVSLKELNQHTTEYCLCRGIKHGKQCTQKIMLSDLRQAIEDGLKEFIVIQQNQGDLLRG